MQTTDSFEKTLMLGKIEGRRRRAWQRMRWLDGIIDSVMSKLQEIVKDREDYNAVVRGVAKSKAQLNDWTTRIINLKSVSQFSHSVVSNSLWPHGPQHARPPCPSPTPRVYPNSCHWVGDAIQPSHPLSSPSPPVFNLSQHQGLFQWLSSLHQVAEVLEFHLQHQSFQWIFRVDFL